VLSWFLGALLMYRFTILLFRGHPHSEIMGILSAVIYTASIVPIVWGSRVLTDMSGYLFLILSIYIIERYKNLPLLKRYTLYTCVIALSILTRDHLMLLLIYLGITVLIDTRFQVVRQIKHYLMFIASAIISLLPSYLWKSYIQIRSAGVWSRVFTTSLFSFRGLLTFIFRSLISFHFLWVFTIIGLFDKDKERRLVYLKIFLSIIPYILLSFLVSLYTPRYTFALFPLVIPAAVYGIIVTAQYFSLKIGIRWVWLVIIAVALYAAFSFFGATLYPSEYVGWQRLQIGGVIELAIEEFKRKWLYAGW
jgi:hypothetical protein